MDSVSVYSFASAPGDVHERMFQPMALEPIPSSAPAWATTHAEAVVYRQHLPTQLAGRTSIIRDELAPETYTKPQPQWKPQLDRKPQPQWKPQPARSRHRSLSESSSIIPPIPPLPKSPKIARPPPAALQIRPYPSVSVLPYSLSEHTESSISGSSPAEPPGLNGTSIAPLNIRRSGRGSQDSFLASPTSPTTAVPPTPTNTRPELPARSPLRPTMQ